MSDDIEKYVSQYGEKYRKVIKMALQFLDEKEPEWGVVMDRSEFVKELMSRIAKDE